MRALLAILVLLRAGTQARMATPCRAGTDHCKIVNTQKSIRAAADRARKSAAEAKDAVRMSRATSVAREAAVRALTNLVNTPRHVEAAQASLAKTKASAARVERLAPSIQRDNLVDLALAAVNAADEATQAQVAAAAARAVADLHALAPVTREEHRPAVKRSAERAAKASRLVADHGHLLPPDLREKAHDLLNEHDFRVHAALDSARPGPALAAIQKKESGYLKAFQKLGGERAATKAKQLPKDEERRKLRATRDVLRAATGLDAEEPVWGAPFRALEGLFRAGHPVSSLAEREAPMEALGVSAKFFEDGTALTKRYHVALSPPCDCWTFGREAVVEQAKSVAESLKAPPLVEAWLDSIAADDTGKLPSVGFGVSAEDGACKLYVLNYGGNELPPLPLLDSLPQTARKPDRAPSVLVSVEWKFGDMKTQQMRQYAVEASADDVAVARHTQDERFAGDELVAALDGTFGVKQSEDIAVTAPFQYDKATTPPVVAAPLAKSGLKLKRQDGNIDSNAETDAKLAALLKAPGADAWLARSRVVRHALSNVQFGEGFVTLYRHPTVFGFVDPSSAPQHLALRNALAKNTRATRRRLDETRSSSGYLDDVTHCDEAIELFLDRAVWGANELDSTCKRDSDLAANAGTCPISCQDDVACLVVACSDCALVDVACDEAIDTAAYPELARHVGGDVDSYDDLDIEDVPAGKIVRLPCGDSGLFNTMNLWGPDGCKYPYYGFMPVDTLCDECSSMYAAREAVLDGLWDGPCNEDDPPGDDDSLTLPSNYPGCGCDCADFLRRDLSCTSESCVNVAQAYAASNTVCAGDKLRWDTTSSSTGCETYGAGSPLTGSACLDAAGAVPNATCYRTPAAISEPGFPWPWPDVCYHMQRDAALGRRASALALVGAIVMMV
mmetsp:Transcript_7920/g.22214  ORF Transcript_7920/g.22214 Transcript_7920/m.22214 type:complete len:903 (+) Transcript_7920:55-2763(+)